MHPGRNESTRNLGKTSGPVLLRWGGGRGLVLEVPSWHKGSDVQEVLVMCQQHLVCPNRVYPLVGYGSLVSSSIANARGIHVWRGDHGRLQQLCICCVSS